MSNIATILLGVVQQLVQFSINLRPSTPVIGVSSKYVRICILKLFDEDTANCWMVKRLKISHCEDSIEISICSQTSVDVE